MSFRIYMNGKLVPREEAVVSIYDHGLLYGDGVFEGIRSYGGRVFKLHEHLERLFESARAIMLEIPLSKEELREAILSTLRANNLQDAYIRLVVTRGVGDLGLDPRKCSRPNIFIITDTINLYPESLIQEGLKVVTVPTQRSPVGAMNPRIKSLNYLNNILAKLEASNAGANEAILLNAQGFVLECSGDNIFIYLKGVLLTPPSYAGVLKGITRDTIIHLAGKMGIEVQEELFSRFEVYNAQECFLTGTAAEIIPVVKVDGRQIGDGKPGEVTWKLMEEFRKLVRKEGVPIYQG